MSSITSKYLFLFVISLWLVPHWSSAQNSSDSLSLDDLDIEEVSSDSLRVVKPGRSALYSTIFPGGGQIYNRTYWKLPIVYLALGTATYAAIWNNQQSQIYLDAFYEQTDPNNSNPSFSDLYTESQLIELYYQHRRWQDLSIIVGALLYGLQILDAYVDGHLYYYDVSDDISLQWQPSVIRLSHLSSPSLGLGLTLSF